MSYRPFPPTSDRWVFAYLVLAVTTNERPKRSQRGADLENLTTNPREFLLRYVHILNFLEPKPTACSSNGCTRFWFRDVVFDALAIAALIDPAFFAPIQFLVAHAHKLPVGISNLRGAIVKTVQISLPVDQSPLGCYSIETSSLFGVLLYLLLGKVMPFSP